MVKTLKDYIPFDFQTQTIRRCLDIIRCNNGCFIMDSTGLGKTITSLVTAINIDSSQNILIIAPEKNKVAWIDTLDGSDVQYTLSGFKTLPKQNDFGIIIVDEAHNFRNAKSEGYINLWKFIRSQKTMPKVLLLSATPFQNNFTEFAATCNLIPFHTNTFAFLFMGNLFKNIIEIERKMAKFKQFKSDIDIDDYSKVSFRDITNYSNLKSQLNDHVKLLVNNLSEFCVRTTREDIVNLFPNDHKAIGAFPTVEYLNIEYQFDNNMANLITNINDKFKNDIPFARYNIQRYTGKSNDVYEMSNGFIKSLLLKRLDSSIECFVSTVEKIIDDNNNVLSQFGKNVVTINEDQYEGLDNKFFDDIRLDNKILGDLLMFAYKCNNDYKLKAMVDNIDVNEKTIIFTEYKESLDIIKNHLIKNTNLRIVTVDGNTTDKLLEAIALDFDANSKKQTNNYDVLICTDVMAEGVNLHRAKKIIHFDNKWNPQKTIQRNGRINRIFKDKIQRHHVKVVSLTIPNIIDNIIKFTNKVENKLIWSEKILAFEWRNIEVKPTQFEPNKNYTIKFDDFVKGSNYIVGILNNGRTFNINIDMFQKTSYDFYSYIKDDIDNAKILKSESYDFAKPKTINMMFKRLKNDWVWYLRQFIKKYMSVNNIEVADFEETNIILNNPSNDVIITTIYQEFKDLLVKYKETAIKDKQPDCDVLVELDEFKSIGFLLSNLLKFNQSKDVQICLLKGEESVDLVTFF